MDGWMDERTFEVPQLGVVFEAGSNEGPIGCYL